MNDITSKKLVALFKMALLVDMFDDTQLEVKSIFTQKDKNIIKMFNTHFKKKYYNVIEQLFEVDFNNDDDKLERMKDEINKYIIDNLQLDES